MESDASLNLFIKVLAFALAGNLAAHYALGLWSSEFAAVLVSMLLAIGVSLGQRLRTRRR